MPSLSFSPFWQMTTTERPVKSGAQSGDVAMERRIGAGDQPRIGGEVLVDAHIDEAGALGVPIRRASFSMEMEVYEDMLRPWERDAIFRHVASWGDRFPHEGEIWPTHPLCQWSDASA